MICIFHEGFMNYSRHTAGRSSFEQYLTSLTIPCLHPETIPRSLSWSGSALPSRHSRCLDWIPSPQEVEQSDHCDHQSSFSLQAALSLSQIWDLSQFSPWHANRRYAKIYGNQMNNEEAAVSGLFSGQYTHGRFWYSLRQFEDILSRHHRDHCLEL